MNKVLHPLIRSLKRVRPEVQLRLLATLLILLSVFGRTFSDVLHVHALAVFHPLIALFSGLALAVCLVALLKGRRERLSVFAAGCLAVGAVAAKLIAVEEASHVVLFTLFGALTARCYGFLFGSLMAIMMAGFDEGIQYFVPRRVFDVRDIGLNSISAVIAIAIYCWRRPD